jgi:glycogen operon protein
MLLMGDEIGRSQHGNNNAYCQDNEITWMQWEGHSERDNAFADFVRGLVRMRKKHALLRGTYYYHGEAIEGIGVPDVVWIRPDSGEMEPDDWENGHTKSIGLVFCATDRRRLLILVNAHHDTVPFRLPDAETAPSWSIAVDTDQGRIDPEEPHLPAGTVFDLPGRSLFMFVAQAQ